MFDDKILLDVKCQQIRYIQYCKVHSLVETHIWTLDPRLETFPFSKSINLIPGPATDIKKSTIYIIDNVIVLADLGAIKWIHGSKALLNRT